MTPNLFILSGPSCSGKSTLAKKKASEEGYYIVSRDDFRLNLFGVYRQGTKEEENLITDLVKGTVITLLSNDKNVVLDNTHLRVSYLSEALSDYNDYADIEFHFMPELPLEVLLERSDLRCATTGKMIPIFVIENQHKAFNTLVTNFKASKLSPRGVSKK